MYAIPNIAAMSNSREKTITASSRYSEDAGELMKESLEDVFKVTSSQRSPVRLQF